MENRIRHLKAYIGVAFNSSCSWTSTQLSSSNVVYCIYTHFDIISNHDKILRYILLPSFTCEKVPELTYSDKTDRFFNKKFKILLVVDTLSLRNNSIP